MKTIKEIKERDAMLACELTCTEQETISEVFDQYDEFDRVAAWKALKIRKNDTQRTFNAYFSAHLVASGRSD